MMTQLTSKVKKIAARSIASVAAISVTALMLFAPVAVFGGTLRGDVEAGSIATGTATGLGNQPLPVIIGGIIRAALGLIGVILVVLIIYAGFLWMTAAGEEEKVTKAKDIIKNCIIGIVIIFAAYAITNFVVNSILTGTGI